MGRGVRVIEAADYWSASVSYRSVPAGEPVHWIDPDYTVTSCGLGYYWTDLAILKDYVTCKQCSDALQMQLLEDVIL